MARVLVVCEANITSKVISISSMKVFYVPGDEPSVEPEKTCNVTRP